MTYFKKVYLFHEYITKMEAHGHDVLLSKQSTQTLVDCQETITLTWKNINVYVNPRKRAKCLRPVQYVPTKQVLRNVCGSAVPGTLLAIIGASGSGKTTLLNTLTSRLNKSSLSASGEVCVNGIEAGSAIQNVSAYVRQDDLFIATTTVREHLQFRALLRMDKELSKGRRMERVEELIKEIGLTKCVDSIIGSPGRMKGISGGEMRRLSFASELLTNPPLLFCDEPTSGLDSFMADNIVQILKSMADKGKTVLCTIHQPSSEVFAKFHQILIMAEGRVAFLGPAHEALNFYNRIGFTCPINFNPADFYIMTMAVVPGKEVECKTRIETICDQFQSSEIAAEIELTTNYMVQNPTKDGIIYREAHSSTSRYEVPWHHQFPVVFKRSWTTTLREPLVMRIRLVQTIMLSIILGLIFLQLQINQEGVMNINGVLFLFLTNMSFTNVFGVLNTFPLETPIFMREYGIGLYRVDVYFISKMFAELPSFLFIPCVFCSITYWMVGLYASAEAFCIFVGVILLVANTSVSFGYILSTAANNVTAALALAAPTMTPLLMFGGFFLNAHSIPDYFIWLEYLSWYKYAFEVIAVNQWKRIGPIACSAANGTHNEACVFKTGAAVIKYLNFKIDRQELDIGLLVVLFVGFRLIAFLILLLKARKSKN